MHIIKSNTPARQVRPASIYPAIARAPVPIIIPDNDPKAAWRALLSDVEWALQRHSISACRFGREAIGDPNLVGDLHAGRMPRTGTVERILGYIDQLDLARVVARFGSVEEGIDRLVDVLIGAKDKLDGDTDAEPGGNEDDFVDHAPDGPGCPIADPDGPTWSEWHTRGRHKLGGRDGEPVHRRNGHPDQHEDDEDDDQDQCLAGDDNGAAAAPGRVRMGFAGDDSWHDPEGDFCLAGDDRAVSGPVTDREIYPFTYGGQEIGDADDAELVLSTSNVPMPPVHSLEPNAFNGKRDYLGHENLMTSFQSNGDSSVRSARSGRRLPRRRHDDRQPGVPV